MRKTIAGALALAMALTSMPALAKEKGSSGRQAQAKGTREIPRCTRNLGAIAIVEPDNQWWREYNLGSPEAILKIFVQQSRCFTIVNRGRSMQSRAMERAMADQGELQGGSNLGRGQVKAADYFLEPNIVSANRNSGGNALGGVLGGIGGGLFGRGAGAGLFSGGTFAAAGAGGYQDTAIGQIIVLAYLDAYTKMVTDLGGLPENAAEAAPEAK